MNDMQNEDEVIDLKKLNLINPDSDKEQFYDWPDELLQRILGSMLYDNWFLLQCHSLIKPSYFRERAHKMICSIILDYFEKYKGRPDFHIVHMEISDKMKDHPTLPYFITELEIVSDAFEPSGQKREYFLDKIVQFAKTQAIRAGVSKTIDVLKQKHVPNRWSLVREILEKALLVDRDTDYGMNYFETIEDRYLRMATLEQDNERFTSGFYEIDEALGNGWCRGELISFAGMSGAGKSLALVKVAKANIQKGKNVLYISLEMDEDKIAERFDAMLVGVPIIKLKDSKDIVIDTLSETKGIWGSLYIKQFPAGTADVMTIRKYYMQLLGMGLKFDCVVVDYVGELSVPDGQKVHEARQRHVRDLRGFATEAKVCVITAMQINRGGRDAIKTDGYIDSDTLSDSFSMITPLDALYTLSQNDLEAKAGIGTLFVSKHRRGKGRFVVRFSRNPDTLEMESISDNTYRHKLSLIENKKIEEVKIDAMAYEGFKPNGGSKNS